MVGHTVNLAARLMSKAEEGQILADAETMELTSTSIRWQVSQFVSQPVVFCWSTS